MLKSAALLAVMLIASGPIALAGNIGGKATVYADSYHGKKTASGTPYNKNAMTAASNTVPLGTKMQVKNKKTGKTATVVINDRKAKGGAVIDLSKGAAAKLGVNGTAPVTGKVVGK